MHEKEEEVRGRVERPSISDKVSDVDEGRGRARTRLLISPTEHDVKPFTLPAMSMKCLRSKTNQPFLLFMFPSLHPTQWNISKKYFKFGEEYTHLQFIF